MAENTVISTIEKNPKKLDDNYYNTYFKYIPTCKCGVFHDFFVKFKKE